MNTLSYFEIQAADVQKAKAFYENVFGWNFVRETFTPIEYYRIETATLFGGLLERPADTPPPGQGTNAFTCSFQVEDFDATAQIIIDNGGQVAMPKFPVPMRYWQGYFLHTDNNVFGIMQVDKYAGVKSRHPGSE